jgi:2-polyprenyl-3-methyl-5-hydroxy-6-metoxy-1,4-benzoquinol methylase
MNTPLDTVAVGCALCGADAGRVVAQGWDFEYATVREEFTVRQCAACAHEYLSPRPAIHELGRIYPPDYYAYDMEGAHAGPALRVKRWLEARRVRRLLAMVSAPEPRCLDIGCGDGAFLEVLHRAGIPRRRLAGVDLSAELVAGLRTRGFEAHAGRVEELPLENGAYDLVLMLQTIEHVEDPVAVFAAVRRLLAPGGILLCETPNVRSLDARLFRRRYWSGYHFPRHWHLFHAESLARLARRAGLEPVRIETYPCVVSWIFPLHHRLRESGAPAWLYRWFWPLRNLPLLALFTPLDVLLAPFGLTSNLRGIFRRPPAP